MAGAQRLGHRRHLLHDLGELVELLGVAPLERLVQDIGKPAQARILGERGQQGLGRRQPVGQPRQLVRIKVEKGVPL